MIRAADSAPRHARPESARTMRLKSCALLASALLLLLTAACSRQASVPGKPVAKVNGAEIPLVRYRMLLAGAREQAGSNKAAAAELMDRMIDRELMAQKARA